MLEPLTLSLLGIYFCRGQVTAHSTGLGITVATATTRDHNGIGPSVLPRAQPPGSTLGPIPYRRAVIFRGVQFS